MEENIKERRIAFLEKALDDAQEAIRFLDSKTAIAIPIVGAYFIGLLLAAENLVEYWKFYSACFIFLLVTSILGLIACVVIIKRIIRPTENPKENINLGGASLPDLGFYLAPNEYKWWYAVWNSEHHKLKCNFSDYLASVNAADHNTIINSLSFELLKVSFIRNIKNDRFKVLVRILIGTSFLATIGYWLYVVETHTAKDVIEIRKASTEAVKEIKKESADRIREIQKESAKRISEINKVYYYGSKR